MRTRNSVGQVSESWPIQLNHKFPNSFPSCRAQLFGGFLKSSSEIDRLLGFSYPDLGMVLLLLLLLFTDLNFRFVYIYIDVLWVMFTKLDAIFDFSFFLINNKWFGLGLVMVVPVIKSSVFQVSPFLAIVRFCFRF